MTRVKHVLHAKKARPDQGIKVGDEYYWWRDGFRGPKKFSKKPPSEKETATGFNKQVLEISESIAAINEPDDIDPVCEEIRSLGEEQEEKFNNLPEGLQSSSTGERLSGRASSCEDWASELETEKDNYPEDDVTTAEQKEQGKVDSAYQTQLDEWLEAVRNIAYAGE